MRYTFFKLKACVLLVCLRPQAALRAFEDMLRIRPHDAYALASSAHLYAARQDFVQALARLGSLVAASPELASGWFNLGYVLQQLGRHREAEAAFRKAVARDVHMDRAWYGLGLTLMHAQQFDEAIGALKKATMLQPMSPHAWYRLAEAWTSLGRHDEAHDVLAHLGQFEPKVAAQLARQTLARSPTTLAPHAPP